MNSSGPLWRLYSFGEEFHPAGQRYWWVNRNREWPGNVNVQYTLQGALRYVQDGQEHLVRQGQACIYSHEDGSEYGVCPEDESYTCLWVSFAGAGMQEHWNQIRERFGPVVTDSSGDLLQLMREVIKTGSLSGEQDVISIAIAVHQFVMRLIRLLDQYSGLSAAPVEQAIARMRANPLYPWALKELAAEEGCSREHFCRVFKQRYKTTPAAWLRQQRTAHARYLLQTTQLTVSEIARQSGLSGPHSLARTLRRICKQGPQAVRRRSGGDI